MHFLCGCSDMLSQFGLKTHVYVLANNGVHVSGDNGNSWEKIRDNSDMIADNTGRIFARNGSVYAAGGNLAVSGISILERGSDTWTTTTTEDGPFPWTPTGLFVDNRGVIFVSSQASGLYISTDMGTTFLRIYDNGVVCVYSDGDTVYAGGRNDSNNNATIWRLDYAGSLQGAVLDLGFDGTVNDIDIKNDMIYAATEDDAGNGYLYASDTDNIVWQQLCNNNGPFLDVTAQEQKIYVTAYNAWDAGIVIFRSGVGITISPEDTLESNACTRIAIDSRKTNIYVVSDNKLCISYNDIHDWHTKTSLDGPVSWVYDVFVERD
jgi:hypothetical protein